MRQIPQVLGTELRVPGWAAIAHAINSWAVLPALVISFLKSYT